MTLRRLVPMLAILTAFTPLSLVACGEDDEEEHEGDDTHEPMSPSCVELSDVCHEADTGTGPGHDCHEVAHSDDEAECASQLASCTATCEAIINDAGM